jgi:hypothetical protein
VLPRRTALRAAALVAALLALAGCRPAEVSAPAADSGAKPSASPTPDRLTAEAVLAALKAAGLPVEREIVYTTETDPNKLLGRPNQYTGKASWSDRRVGEPRPDERSMTVEVFASAEDLEGRRRYVETIGKALSPLAQYQFAHKNALLRLNHDLTPQQASEYERVLKGL